MAASVAEGDRVMVAALLGAIGSPLTASLDGSGVLSQPPHVGYVFNVAGTAADVLWDDGQVALALPCDDASVVSVLKLGAAGDPASWLGKVVQRTDHNASAEFTGVVLFVGTLIAKPLAPASAPVEFVIVQSRGPSQLLWIAPTSAVELAAGN